MPGDKKVLRDMLYKDSVIESGNGINYYTTNSEDENDQSPMLDPGFGGQMGFRPEVFGPGNVIALYNDTKALSGQLIPLVLQIPKAFGLLDNTADWVRAFKTIFEDRPDSINGMNAGLTAEFVESAVGGAGEMASQIANMTRERTVPVFKWRDIVGLPIQKLLTFWMEFILMDSETKIPRVNTLETYKLTAWTKDYQALTMIFIELDQAGMYVLKSWLVTDMQPTSNGPVTGRRDLLAAAEPIDLEITFTGVAAVGVSINSLAASLLPHLNIVRTDSEVSKSGYSGDETVVDTIDAGFGKSYKTAKENTVSHSMGLQVWE